MRACPLRKRFSRLYYRRLKRMAQFRTGFDGQGSCSEPSWVEGVTVLSLRDSQSSGPVTSPSNSTLQTSFASLSSAAYRMAKPDNPKAKGDICWRPAGAFGNQSNPTTWAVDAERASKSASSTNPARDPMHIARLRISGFRGIQEADVRLTEQSVLVGPNGCGKEH